MAEPTGGNVDVLAADSRAALLEALRASGRPLSVAEAASAVGIGESTARAHLTLLATAGLVTRTAERRATAGRPALRYAPAASAPPRPPSTPDHDGGHDDLAQLRQFASVLAAHIGATADPITAARTAGQRWSAELAAAEPGGRGADEDTAAALVDLMGRLGFEPEARTRGEIWLHRCPFEEVARQHRAVVCGVHLGMLEQTVGALGGDADVESLEPFAEDEPLLCIVRLARRRRGRDDGGAQAPAERGTAGGETHD